MHSDLTGIGRYAVNLILSLERVRANHLIYALTTQAGADFLKSAGSLSPAVIASGGAEWDQLVLPDLLRELNGDVFHSPLFVLPRVRSCASICTIHDAIPLVRPNLCPRSFLEFFHRNIGHAVKAASHIVTVSEHSRADLLRELQVDPAKVSAIHEPVSPLFRPKPEGTDEKLLSGVGLEPGFVLAVGALDRRKNLGTLLSAYALLGKEMANVPPLAIVGGPSGDGYQAELDVAAQGLGRSVRLLGRVTDETLAALYRGAAVFVFPSLYEGFGLPVVEAMASGTVAVASNASSLPEIAGDAAILIDPLDVKGLKDALAQVLTDPTLRADLSRKGLCRAAQFSLESQGERLLALYRQVLEDGA